MEGVLDVYTVKADKTNTCTVNGNYMFNVLNPMCFLIDGIITLTETYGDSLELTLDKSLIETESGYDHPFFQTLRLHISDPSFITIRGHITNIIEVTPTLTEILICELPNWDAFRRG
jgi:hypothetical protein